MSNQDYLTEEKNLLPLDQNFVCLSFLTPTKEDKTTLSGIKIRGVFNTYEDACEHAKKLQSIDEYHNVFVGAMGKWLPFDPNPESVKESEYANNKLNDIMKNYEENQEKSKIFHEHQKNEQIKKNLNSNIEQRLVNKKELNDSLSTVSEGDKESLLQNMDEIEKQIKKMETRKQELEELNNELSLKLKTTVIETSNENPSNKQMNI